MATVVKSSRQWLINAEDVAKSIAMAMLGAVVPIIYQTITQKQWVFDWTAIWHAAAVAGVTYLFKNWISTSKIVITGSKLSADEVTGVIK